MTFARAMRGALAALLLAVPVMARAQQRPLSRADSVRADSLRRAAGDTLRLKSDSAGITSSDTVKKKREIDWAPTDSVMSSLMSRPGYSVTRYQGKNVEFRAKQREIYLVGKPSVVSRDSATLVGDTITFNDSTQIIHAKGDTLLIRDPAQGPDDIVALHEMRYDVKNREGLVRDVRTTVESGQRWTVGAQTGAFKGDSSANGTSSAAFYGRNGWLTSCEEVEPHYHFASKELKLVSKNIMVARPAVLYIADIPVAWLPFVFQDMRTGRRSGIIPPRFGVSDIVRNSTSYRRTIDDLGYYFAISDYMDARVSMDWRSDAGSTESNPGWVRLNGTMNYRWLNRFLSGSIAASQHAMRDGSSNTEYSVRHQQDFSQRTHINADFNYATNTTVHRNTTFNPYAALALIKSQLNYTTGRGPFTLAVGGDQTQYSGRKEIDQNFPSINLTSKAISIGDWFSWTPGLNTSNQRRLHIDNVGEFSYRYLYNPDGSIRDSVALDRNTYASNIRFETPVEIFGFNWRNSFSLTNSTNDFPERRTIYLDPTDSSSKVQRVFKSTFTNKLDWETSFSLPSILQSSWKVTPQVHFQKIDPRGGLLMRTERTGNKWVSQGLRPSVGIGISPTFYGIFGGFGPIAAIRHSISPQLTYSWSPKQTVSDDFLSSFGGTRFGYLGDKTQNILSLNLQTSFEAKLRTPADSIGAEGTDLGRKLKLLSVNFQPLSYDFERARITKRTGITNSSFGYSLTSDLLPGLNFGINYSLFQGDPISDSAVFKPYRDQMHGSIALGASSPLVRAMAKLFGFKIEPPTAVPQGSDQSLGTPSAFRQTGGFSAGQPLAGSINRATSLQVPSGQGWQLNLNYTATRQRPPVGSNILSIDPTAQCDAFKQSDPFAYQLCVQRFNAQASNSSTIFNPTTLGGTFYRVPPQQSVQGSMSFHLTEKWATQWSTTYDFVANNFASQVVSLQRSMHDWDAIFAFTKAPNGNFAFNFFIALKAEPDLKFNYDRRDYPRGYSGIRR